MQSFGQTLSMLMQQRKITVVQLRELVDYKSSTSLHRILRDEVSSDNNEAFLAQLKEADNSLFTPAEWNMLEQALCYSKLGEETYWNWEYIASLVFPNDEEHVPPPRVMLGGSAVDFVTMLSGFMQGSNAQVTITGCCTESLFMAIRKAMEGKAAGCHIQLTHYVCPQPSEQGELLRNIQPVMYHKGYELLYMDLRRAEGSLDGHLYQICTLLIQGENQAGEKLYAHMVKAEPGTYIMQYLNEESYGFYLTCLEANSKNCRPARSFFPEVSSVENYLQYIKYLGKLEKNREIFLLRKDIPINMMHPNYLRDSAIDGFREKELLPPEMPREMAEEVIEPFYQIQLARFNNMLEKRKMTHMVLSKHDMLEFAQHGHASDHFYGMRDFNREECVGILKDLQTIHKNNPYIKIHFLKDALPIPEEEIGMYEGVGLLFVKPDTSYRLDDDHTETLITDNAVCKCYREYYLGELIKKHVLSDDYTTAYLQELVNVASTYVRKDVQEKADSTM